MDKSFIEIKPEQFTDNTFKLIGSDWMLITAGTLESYNTMTASWGGFGILWNKNICFCVVRPTRHTYNFIEKSGAFSLSFFDDKYREALQFCGSHSGRDVDKASSTGLTPVASDNGTVYFNEARLVIECKKLYFQDIDPKNFMDITLDKNYPLKDYHRMYIGEISKSFLRK